MHLNESVMRGLDSGAGPLIQMHLNESVLKGLDGDACPLIQMHLLVNESVLRGLDAGAGPCPRVGTCSASEDIGSGASQASAQRQGLGREYLPARSGGQQRL